MIFDMLVGEGGGYWWVGGVLIADAIAERMTDETGVQG